MALVNGEDRETYLWVDLGTFSDPIWNTKVEQIILPTGTGQICLEKGHADLITNLSIGVVRYKLKGIWYPIIILGGIARINNNKLLVIANAVEEVIKDKYSEVEPLLEKAREEFSFAKTEQEKKIAKENLQFAEARKEAYKFI